MKRGVCLALALLAGGCCSRGSKPSSTVTAPDRMQFALTVAQVVSDLGATAELVSRSGERAPAVELTRGADGVSFSGFLPADPGDYTLELSFSGVRTSGGSERIFLGRLTSDAFTVALGATADPRFSRGLDTIGRAEDHGDDDADGLGLLDELLVGADPAKKDSDQDGVDDGRDCDPMDLTRSYLIVPGGDLADCDGDGARRVDLGFGGAGTDCDDKDATIKPGAQDVCTDAIDQDCNPATCPVDDRERPSIANMIPEDNAMVGCQTAIRASLRDNGTVISATAELVDAPAGGRNTLYFTRASPSDDLWVAEPFDNASGPDGLPAGRHTVRIHALDLNSNEAVVERTYDFQFDFVRVTNITPVDVGIRNAPFQMTIEATAALGLKSITLYRAPKSESGTYAAANAVMIGMSATSPATFTVDPAGLADGEYILYAIAEDVAGNKTDPSTTLYPIGGGPNGLAVTLLYRCIASAMTYQMPARVMVVGTSSPYMPAKIGDHLDEAIALAAAADPAAVMVSIIGYGLRPDGTIQLDDASSYTKRIQYSFYNATSRKAVSVTWFTPAWTTMQNPVVDPDAGNVTAEEPLGDPHALANSDVVASHVAARAACPDPSGTDDDWILYVASSGVVHASVYLASGQYWYGTAIEPLMTISDCQ